MKSRDGKSQRREENVKKEYQQRESLRRIKSRCAKGRKVAKHCVYPMICGSGGSKSRLAKAAGAEPSGRMRDEKLHAVVARSTFGSQNVQSTPGSDHFWKLRCRKNARMRYQGGDFPWQTGGVEKSQNALVRGRQLCTQRSIFEGSLAKLLRF